MDILTCGVCHTDLHYRQGGITDDFPILLGHEATRVVSAIGPSARTTAWTGRPWPRDTRSLKTDIGRGRFTVSPLEYLTPPDGHLVLQTIRSHDQYNTTFYGHDRQADKFRLVAYPTAKGCAAAYFPEANALVHQENVARESNSPGFKAMFVRFEPHGPLATDEESALAGTHA